jgi:adenylate cyclase
MQNALQEFNRTRIAENQQPVHVGVGVNSGEVIYGAIGSSKTLQYTVIGDAVNTASRLCSVAKANEVIISGNTFGKVHHHINAVELPKVKVKGKLEELTIYRAVGVKNQIQA